ncbi:hypothetical protein KCU81_g6548, partial [Aureobasidium melanogenum]|uniref:F-box domain-containing protein n=1 Tax=Aureobasidium melanogenum (strain CBS 110374) TaxID=1043003 RepID=A0A074VX47_AURM1
MDPINVNLPVELLDHIIRFTIPDSDYLAYSASHPTTKTLLALCMVSKATNRSAKALLYTHCLYIDEPWRLDLLLTRSFCQPDFQTSATHIKNLYLSPFSRDTIREPKVVTQVAELFTLLSPSLKRLIINMPLRSHYPEEDTVDKLRPILRSGFEQLVHLEEFCSIEDELYLAYWDPTFSQQVHLNEVNDFMFERWTKLSRLALYNQMLDPAFSAVLARMPNLEKVVLSEPDYEGDEISWASDMAHLFGDRIRFTVVNATDRAPEAGIRSMKCTIESSRAQSDTWKYNVFTSDDLDEIPAVQNWSLQCALDGSLWSLPDDLDTH